MLRLCSKTLVKMGMVKPCHFGKPVSATLVASRNLTQQKRLPSQPVPPLRQTCELYLNTLEPVVEVDELKRTKELVEEFQKAGGVGERLQRGLERKARNTENWSSDDMLKESFLNDRMPVVVFSNTAGMLPKMKELGQIRCAAEVIKNLLEIRTMAENETLPIDHVRGIPLCMNQCKQLMSSCRIPGLKTDSVAFYSESAASPKHITVVHNCQFFVLDVYNSDGTVLTVDELCVQLERIRNLSLHTNMEPVGILTTQHRDIWSKIYMDLIKDKTSKESLSAIQSSIFTVCLDGASTPVSDETDYTNVFHQLSHGEGSQRNSGNRWFDKGLQIIITEDGICGANSSHVVSDGTVLLGVGDHLASLINREKPQMQQSPGKPLPMPQNLPFNITPEIKKDIEEAKQQLDILISHLDLRINLFDHFGKNVIKAHKLSPDAFVQMALQLAYYRMYQQCCVVQEPASLRMFRMGRVALFNSNTSASVAFVKAFDDPKKQNSEKLDFLEKAIKVHKSFTRMANSGEAIHGHLLGLRMQAVEENIPMPDIFTDISYTKAFNHKIITSLLLSNTGCLSCPGPRKPGSYTMFYCIMKNQIYITMCSYDATNTHKESNGLFIQAIEDALLDMRTLVEQTSRAEL